MIGIVYKSTGSHYILLDPETEIFWHCRIRGKLKIDKQIKSTNPIAVGDKVLFNCEDERLHTGIIQNIVPRTNYIVRKSPHNRHHKHIIAANIDQTLLIATIAAPKTSLGFIDRFLITAEMYHIPAILVINKTDLLDADDNAYLTHIQSIYEEIGYTFVAISAIHQQHESISALKQILKGKTTLISGHSGVGKSTIINQLDNKLTIKTGDVSEWSGKGQHTTTFAEMHMVDDFRIIDTPGLKEFGLIDIDKEELAQYFPEMRAAMHACKFNNCQHINEPHCAVKNEISEGKISIERYESYLSIYASIEQPSY